MLLLCFVLQGLNANNPLLDVFCILPACLYFLSVLLDKTADNAATHNYPSSSRKFHDWDKMAANIEKEDSEEKKEGDAALNDLFQKIYANADEDTKRAMNKSFQESGGTVLSTNWKDIGKKKVEVKPPDGMEYKKYEI